MRLPRTERVYRVLMGVLALLLLSLFLICEIEGVLTLCLYEDLAGLGRMVIGVLLYFGGKLALAERNAATS